MLFCVPNIRWMSQMRTLTKPSARSSKVTIKNIERIARSHEAFPDDGSNAKVPNTLCKVAAQPALALIGHVAVSAARSAEATVSTMAAIVVKTRYFNLGTNCQTLN